MKPEPTHYPIPRRLPSVKVVEKKIIGRYKAYGLAWKDQRHAAVDPRQPVREHCDSLIHEALHILFPIWPEWLVFKVSTRISNVLWKFGYRRIHQDGPHTKKIP